MSKRFTRVTREDGMLRDCLAFECAPYLRVTYSTREHESYMAWQHRNVATGWAGKAGVTWRQLVRHQVLVDCIEF